MTLETTFNSSRTVKTTQDTHNPRLNNTEYKCAACGDWANEDETIWVPGQRTGKPYHVGCAPTGE